MARITRVRVRNYRSVRDPVEIAFPPNMPIVLLGENNAGKSNIVKALQLILGPIWPGTHEPEDHEFCDRVRERPIEIMAEFDPAAPFGERRYASIRWRHDPNAEEPTTFKGHWPSGAEGYIRNIDRDTCVCMVLEAERNLKYHLSYASKWTLLSRLMHKFHKALLARADTREELERLFEAVKARFAEIPEFSDFERGLKEQLAQLVASMTHRLQVDFEAYNPVNFFHALELHAAEGDEPRTFDEMGTGEQQVLAMAFAYAYARAFHGGIILVIEEPEAHLHPLAQQWLAKRLRAMAEGGLQVLLTTHSAAFVDLMNLAGLVLVRKDATGTKVVQLGSADLVRHCENMGVPPGRVTADNVLPFYAASVTLAIREGFFSKVVVLVEGPTEALALPVYLERAGVDVCREGVAVVPVGGKGNLAKWRRLFTAYGIPCYVVFDNDSEEDRDGTRRHDALLAVGVPEGERDRLIQADEWVVGPELAIFGSDFEHVLRQHFGRYRDLEAAARREGMETKPFVARWVAERLELQEMDAGTAKLRELASAIRARIPPTAEPAVG